MRKSFMIIGQAQGEKWKNGPFPRSKLWPWFETIGWAQEQVLHNFHFDALINTGTAKAKKGRVSPAPEQIARYRPDLLATIDKIKPRLIVPVGGLAVKHVLDNRLLELDRAVGQRFVMKPFGAAKNDTLVIPLPHPSGVSLWLNAETNRALWRDAMRLIRAEIGAPS